MSERDFDLDQILAEYSVEPSGRPEAPAALREAPEERRAVSREAAFMREPPVMPDEATRRVPPPTKEREKASAVPPARKSRVSRAVRFRRAALVILILYALTLGVIVHLAGREAAQPTAQAAPELSLNQVLDEVARGLTGEPEG